MFDASSAVQMHVEAQLQKKLQEQLAELRRSAVEDARKELGEQLDEKAATIGALEEKLKDSRKVMSDVVAREKKLQEDREQLDAEVKLRVDRERVALRKQAELSIREEFELKIEAKDQEVKEAKGKVRDAQEKEIAFHKKAAQLEDQKREMEVEMQRQLAEERGKLQAEAARKASEAAALKLQEQNGMIKQLREQLTAAQQKLEQGSQQAQGEAQELVLEQRLREAFPADDFREVEKGAEGADILQVVRDGRGRECGSILWESKRTRHWSPAWLQKLAEDRARENASVAAIASQALPKEIDLLGQLEGVWVCSLAHATVLGALLRKEILSVAEARLALVGQTEKMSMLYSYLTGPDFRNRVMAVVTPLARVMDQLERERKAMTKIWDERKRLIRLAATGMSGLHTDVQCIAGVDLASLPNEGDGIAELAAIAADASDQTFEIDAEVPWNQPSGDDGELTRELLEKLRGLGGSSGNLSLRRELGWDEDSYYRIKTMLVASRVLVVGPGRGGSVRIVDAKVGTEEQGYFDECVSCVTLHGPCSAGLLERCHGQGA